MKKIIPIAGLVLGIFATCASAATEITKKEFDVSTGVLRLFGTTDSDSGMMTLNIPNNGLSGADLQAMSDELISQNLLYCGQKEIEQDGSFEFTVTVSQNEADGIYNIYLGADNEETSTQSSFSFTDSNEYALIIQALNSAAQSGQSAFDSLFDTNEDILFYYPEATGYGTDKIKKILCDYAKNVGFSESDSVQNTKVFKTALCAQLLSEARYQDAEELFDDMYKKTDGAVNKYASCEDYRSYVDTQEKEAYFSTVFVIPNTLDEFEKSFTDAIILTVVKYPGNVTTLKEFFDRYSAYTGANVQGAGLTAYSKISGNSYSSVPACVSVFNAALTQSPPAGGGGGGGGGAASDRDNDFGIVSPGIGAANEKIDIGFNDLNSVQWAYNAISELYERKIISGRSETTFAPNDNVKREEFAKMLVDMAGIELNSDSDIFSDVKADAWYKDYVNTAYRNGLCSGVSDGVFGAGREISRQDMCVMAYNVLNKLGYSIPDAELTFADASDFGVYAKAPVAALNKAGIVSGVGDNRFNPKGNATRAEAAVIIFRLLSFIE